MNNSAREKKDKAVWKKSQPQARGNYNASISSEEGSKEAPQQQAPIKKEASI